MARKIGLYLCHCGINIASTVDIERVKEYATSLQEVAVVRDYPYMCSDPGQNLIQEDIQGERVDRVVVAACSPRMHEATFRQVLFDAGLNPYLLEMANVREQCSWVHPQIAAGTEKAKELVAAATARARILEPINEREVSVEPKALIIGGGTAGLHAALDIAAAGFSVYLVEQEPSLGGRVMELYSSFPQLTPAACLIPPVVEQVQEEERIQVMTSTTVRAVEGYIGNFQIQVEGPEGEEEFTVGTIVVATGFTPFDARKKKEYAFGESPRIISSLDLEKRLVQGDLSIQGEEPKSVAFIQCVGSRDESVGHSYCSRVCCMYTAKEAALMKKRYPQTQIRVYYMDVRAFGKGCEEFYDTVRRMGVRYVRGNPSQIYLQGDRPVIEVEDTLNGQVINDPVDLVVLAVGMEPRDDSSSLGNILHLSASADGFFLEAHPKLRPVETAVEGIYLAGTCQGPKDIPDTIAQARGAAAAALIPLSSGQVKGQALVATIHEDLCRGCGLCVDFCVYEARQLNPIKKIAQVEEVLCQGCGGCVMACPNGATQQKNASQKHLLAMVDAVMD